jgi:hypothetical protein
MVALKSERMIYLWRMSPHASPKEAPVDVKFEQIFEILKATYENKEAFAHVDAKGKVAPSHEAAENCIFIADIQKSRDGKTCSLLINRGDPDVAHPSFINPKAQTVTHVPPGRGEVQGWSAHMVIRTAADGMKGHRAAFERMQNVSSTLVQRYIDALVDKATEGKSEFTYKKPIKKGKKTEIEIRSYKLRLSINKVPSDDLVADVKKGRLSAIKLIRTKPEYSGPGDPTIVSSISEVLRIGTKNVDENSALDYIKKIRDWGKENEYDEVQFSITELPGGSTAHPRFEIEKLDAMDTIYSRSHRITGFSGLLETCYQEIDAEIAGKMIAELSNESLWK